MSSSPRSKDHNAAEAYTGVAPSSSSSWSSSSSSSSSSSGSTSVNQTESILFADIDSLTTDEIAKNYYQDLSALAHLEDWEQDDKHNNAEDTSVQNNVDHRSAAPQWNQWNWKWWSSASYGYGPISNRPKKGSRPGPYSHGVGTWRERGSESTKRKEGTKVDEEIDPEELQLLMGLKFGV